MAGDCESENRRIGHRRNQVPITLQKAADYMVISTCLPHNQHLIAEGHVVKCGRVCFGLRKEAFRVV